jgi:hypothetical protein
MKQMKPLVMLRVVILSAVLSTTQSCYQYRVLNTNNDPSTEYQEIVLKSYAWGLVNKPKDFHVPNCDNSNAIDEVTFAKSAGQSILTMITLGIVSKVTVRWKCHKPCERVDSL